MNISILGSPPSKSAEPHEILHLSLVAVFAAQGTVRFRISTGKEKPSQQPGACCRDFTFPAPARSNNPPGQFQCSIVSSSLSVLPPPFQTQGAPPRLHPLAMHPTGGSSCTSSGPASLSRSWAARAAIVEPGLLLGSLGGDAAPDQAWECLLFLSSSPRRAGGRQRHPPTPLAAARSRRRPGEASRAAGRWGGLLRLMPSPPEWQPRRSGADVNLLVVCSV